MGAPIARTWTPYRKLLLTLSFAGAVASGCQRSPEGLVVRPEPAPPPLIVRPAPDSRAAATAWPRQLPPVMYVDDVRVEEGMGGRIMSELGPDRIDRIEILKGAAAASRFPDDVEAQRGVILIYTKRDSGRE